MSGARVLLAGLPGELGKKESVDTWLPHLLPAGLQLAGVWLPAAAEQHESDVARALAAEYSVDLHSSAYPSIRADCAIVFLAGEERRRFLEWAGRLGLPVLIDNAAFDSTDDVEQLTQIPELRVMSSLHLSSHPSYTRALTAVRAAEVGLLRAVAIELVVAARDNGRREAEVRGLCAQAIDLIRQATGPTEVRLQAHRSDDSWSFTGQTGRDVVVSSHASCISSNSDLPRFLRASVRFTGTHGSMLVDLTKPSLDLQRSDGSGGVVLGETSKRAHLRRFASLTAAGRSAAPAADLVVLSHALDSISESAVSGAQRWLAW